MTEPTQPADYSRYEPTQTEVPPIPPPPPPPVSRRKWWHIAVPALMVVALVALIVVPNAVLGKKPTPVARALPTPTATIAPTQLAPTVPPTPTVNTTVMSSVPLIEPGANNWFYCYVVPDDTNSDAVFAVLSNPDQHRVYEDCKSFMSYGPYFSVQPSYVQASGELRLDSTWAADNTYWRVMGQVEDLIADQMMGALDQILPGAQG